MGLVDHICEDMCYLFASERFHVHETQRLVEAKVTPDRTTFRFDRDLEHLVAIEDVDSAGDESKVVAAPRHGELANQHALRVPSEGRSAIRSEKQ